MQFSNWRAHTQNISLGKYVQNVVRENVCIYYVDSRHHCIQHKYHEQYAWNYACEFWYSFLKLQMDRQMEQALKWEKYSMDLFAHPYLAATLA